MKDGLPRLKEIWAEGPHSRYLAVRHPFCTVKVCTLAELGHAMMVSSPEGYSRGARSIRVGPYLAAAVCAVDRGWHGDEFRTATILLDLYVVKTKLRDQDRWLVYDPKTHEARFSNEPLADTSAVTFGIDPLPQDWILALCPELEGERPLQAHSTAMTPLVAP